MAVLLAIASGWWWSARQSSGDIVLRVPQDQLFARAVFLTKQYDEPGQDGMWKHRQVYARLLKEFPDRPKRDVTLAIEAAIR